MKHKGCEMFPDSNASARPIRRIRCSLYQSTNQRQEAGLHLGQSLLVQLSVPMAMGLVSISAVATPDTLKHGVPTEKEEVPGGCCVSFPQRHDCSGGKSQLLKFFHSVLGFFWGVGGIKSDQLVIFRVVMDN